MLIKCPECKKEISDKSIQCIHCGYPVSGYMNKITNEDKSMENVKNVETITLAGGRIIDVTGLQYKLKESELKDFSKLSKILTEEYRITDFYISLLDSVLRYNNYKYPKNYQETYDAMCERNSKRANTVNVNKPKCPKCGCTEFTPVRKKFSILTGFATNKVDIICNKCGTKIK